MNGQNDIELTPELKKLAEDATKTTNMTSEQAFEYILEALDRYNKWLDKLMEIPPLPESKEGIDILPYIQTGK